MVATTGPRTVLLVFAFLALAQTSPANTLGSVSGSLSGTYGLIAVTFEEKVGDRCL